MLQFLRKHKWRIAYSLVILLLVGYFTPAQKKYFLNNDINTFKIHRLIPALAILFGATAIILFFYWMTRTKSIRQSATGFFTIVIVFAFAGFIFLDIFLGIALFLNRQITTGSSTATYHVTYLAGAEASQDNFFLYDSSASHVLIDRKLLNTLYTPGLAMNQAISLTMKQGLFGVPFYPPGFRD